ncbi:MAG: SHOCT domain-containing protein [Candidatus Jorgensenbacteria bacterium]|nr:SHOCT domain-containing protein [Candidatus Jorgensenbacteria bacterium]
MMHWGNWYGGWEWGWMGWIIMIVWWVIIIWFAIAAIRWLSERSRPEGGSRERSPLDILKERYAKGELDQKEYEEKRKVLES